MQRALARRLRTFADLNFLIVNARQQLTEIAHVEIRPAEWAIAEMIGQRDRDRNRWRCSGSSFVLWINAYPWLSTTLPSCVIGT
jgi:hypothetical protein